MPTMWPDSAMVRVHAHPESVLGSTPGRAMGGGGNDTGKEKEYDQTGTETQDLSQTTLIL